MNEVADDGKTSDLVAYEPPFVIVGLVLLGFAKTRHRNSYKLRLNDGQEMLPVLGPEFRAISNCLADRACIPWRGTRDRMAQVFISYSHQTASKAALIADGLAAEGYSLWWDKKLRSGDNFAADIEAQLEDAKCVVVVWSSAARNSLWVRAEASAAFEANKLVQVAADGAKPPLPFTMLHLLDFSNWSGQRQHPTWQELDGSVRAVVAGGGVHERDAAIKEVGPSLFAPMLAVGAGSIGLVALAGTLSTIMAASPQQAGMFGSVTIGMFVAACLGLGYMLMRTIEIGLASRRRA